MAYAVLVGMQRGLGLLLLPIYAAALPPGEYGQIALLVSITTVLGVLLGFGLESAVVRFIVQLSPHPAERRRFVNTVGLFALLAPFLGAVAVAGILAVGTEPGALAGAGLDALVFALVGMAVQTTVTVFIGAALWADERLQAFGAVTLAQAIGNQALTLTLVVGLHLGPVGWFAGTLLGAVLSLVIGLRLMDHRWSAEFDPRYLWSALVFGIPLLPHMVSHWVLSLSDRMILSAFVGAGELGVYTVAYQLASIIGLGASAMRRGLMPLYAGASDKPDVREGLSRYSTYQVHGTLIAGLAVALLGPPAVLLLLPAAYAAAGGLMPWIALGYVLFGLCLIPTDSITLMLGQTRWLWVATAVAGASNVVLNLVFVPLIGVMAAAVNTAVGYGILLLGMVAYRRVLTGPRLRYETSRMAAGVAVVALAALVGLLIPTEESAITALLARLAVVAAASIVLVAAHLTIWRRPPGGGGRGSSHDSEAWAGEPTVATGPQP